MNDKKEEVVIVGIGASAGGLEALQNFVKNLPLDANISCIVAQHLSPTYKSMMVELLQKDSKVSILEAKDGIIPAANTLYICPPNKNITVKNNVMHLSHPNVTTYSPKPSVDLLFESLADSKKEKAIGIILSGTGADGSRGIKAIKAEGGFTLAQEPESAKYDGMPSNAINTGNIDLILAPEDIGKELRDIIQYPVKMSENNDTKNKNYTDVYKNILHKLVQETKVDFTQYKSSTIIRRIERRMTTLKIASVANYNNYLLKNKEEANELFKDILIGVTSFFRDGEPFEKLQEYLSLHIKNKEDNIIRIWTPGCSTGEEPYTIAMILSEILGTQIAEYKIQIFASDLDTVAIDTARKGIYPESAILDMPKKFRTKYFTIKADQYELIKPIKEMVIFSKHDITRDPPFLRLDLISCRNLLIYFTSELQKKIFPLFHYSLKAKGLLFLGKSESVGQFQNYFKTVDKKWKIYEAIYLGRKEAPILRTNYVAPKYKEPEILLSNIKPPSMNEVLVAKIQEFILPSCVIVNEMMDIVYVKGKNRYLIKPDGDSSDNIFKNINHKLSIELRALFTQAKDSSSNTLLKSKYHKVELDNNLSKFVRIALIPVLEDTTIPPLYIIYFQDEDLEHIQSIELGETGANSDRVKQVELELIKTREQLQTVIEELETSNEEMQSMNEELQSSNEELQSSNEELETTNEELQSTNEELQTAYAELRSSYSEKEEQQNELEKLQNKILKANNLLDESQALANMASWEWNIVTNELTWSANYFNILEIYNHKFFPTYESFLGFIYPEDRVKFEESIADAIKGKSLFNLIFRVKTRKANIKSLKVIATVIFDENRRALKMLGNVVDITAQEKLEEKNSELLYLTKEIIKSQNGLVTCNKDDIVVNISQAALKILEKDEQEVIGKDIKEFIGKRKYKELKLENKDSEFEKIYVIEILEENKL